jgi:hypothetical protein
MQIYLISNKTNYGLLPKFYYVVRRVEGRTPTRPNRAHHDRWNASELAEFSRPGSKCQFQKDSVKERCPKLKITF